MSLQNTITLELVREIMSHCTICPRNCGVNRTQGEKGVCEASATVEVSSINLHYGEEPPISGIEGSGTIFLTHCNLRCIYCQNYPISQLGNGREINHEDLVLKMLELQQRGALNINFVTPTHYTPQLALAIQDAKKQGLSIPIVWNTSSYESLEGLRLLDGLVDIYLADLRYMDYGCAKTFSKAEDYPSVAKQALKEMHRQVGELQMDERDIAVKGLIIRHLVMPNDASSTKQALTWIKDELSENTYISLMSQYFPAFKARNFPPMDRELFKQEYNRAKKILGELGLENGWVQGDPIGVRV